MSKIQNQDLSAFDNFRVRTNKNKIELVKYVRDRYSLQLKEALSPFWKKLEAATPYSSIDEAAVGLTNYLTRCHSELPGINFDVSTGLILPNENFQNEIISYLRIAGDFNLDFSLDFTGGVTDTWVPPTSTISITAEYHHYETVYQYANLPIELWTQDDNLITTLTTDANGYVTHQIVDGNYQFKVWYENIPSSLHCAGNGPAWERHDTNVTATSYWYRNFTLINDYTNIEWIHHFDCV